MAKRTEYLYDVFISYSPADREWVAEWLLPRLEQAGLRVAIDYRDFIVGMPRIENIERAIANSRRTIAVLTPEWLDSEWNAFEGLLVRTLDPAALKRKLLPVLLRPCELPESIAALEKVDLTVERYWERQVRRLVRDVEDAIPIPAPWRERGGMGDWARWRRWLRRYRRQLRWGTVGVLLAWLLLFMVLQLPPFQPRPVWMAESLHAPHALVLHNSGTTLMVGGENIEQGCNLPHKGLWYRPLEDEGAWRDSDVGDLLCIEEWDTGPALSNIQALASLPAEPDTIYVLTSHSGLLVSNDAGAHFSRHPAGIPPLDMDNMPLLLVVSGERSPIFWVAGEKRGLLIYRDGQWSRLDEQGEGGCAGLPPDLTVRSLLVTDEAVLIGSDQRGLWISDDGGRTCRQVFDAAGRYEFRGLWDIRKETHHRYLALVRDWHVEPGSELGTWQLLDLCPRPTSCSQETWRSAAVPLWHRTTSVEAVLVQQEGAIGDYEWYLVTARGQIWHGDLSGSSPRQLPGITRCFFHCEAALAPAEPGSVPYLLAADRVYRFTEGAWWRRWWP